MALGVALVFGVMRLMNFAYGALIMIGGYLLLALGGAPWPVYVLLSIFGVCLAALAMERIAFRPLRGADASTLLVTSFALVIGLEALASILLGSRAKSVNILPSLSGSVGLLGSSIAWIDIATIVCAVALMVAFSAFLRFSPLGMQVRGVFAGTAAVLLVAQTGTLTPSMGLTPVLIAFVATVIGGMGSLYGAALGGAVLGILSVALPAALPVGAQPYRNAMIFTIVILILLVRPQGLVGNAISGERI
ncbi:MAG: branched-chain amino acid ABC transporter permease [Actinobacteria bacterium]|nr:branched-chain amino acid ABC transporter permease [Actinomycetota bacterium]